MVGYRTPTGLNLQTSHSTERFQGQRQRPSALPGSCQSTSAGMVSIPCRRIFLAHSCPILIVQVHAASVIKLSSRTVAVIHKSHLAKRSRRTGVRGQWVGQRRTLWKFHSFPKLVPASFGHLYPRWPGRSFLLAARPRVRLSCAWDHLHAAYAHAFNHSTRFSRHHRTSPPPRFAVPTIESLDVLTNAMARCPIRRSRSRRTLQFNSSKAATPAPFRAQRRSPSGGRLGA